jgi:hypothetical protein
VRYLESSALRLPLSLTASTIFRVAGTNASCSHNGVAACGNLLLRYNLLDLDLDKDLAYQQLLVASNGEAVSVRRVLQARKSSSKKNGRRRICGPSFARLSNSALATYQSSHEDDHDKRQPSTSLSGGSIHFLSRCSITTCNDITFTHQGVRVKDRGVFLVEKSAFSCRRHFPRHDSRDVASLSTRLLF